MSSQVLLQNAEAFVNKSFRKKIGMFGDTLAAKRLEKRIFGKVS